jgi:hypothetical protein
MRPDKTWLLIGIATVVLIFSSPRAFGQGGTGRETTNANANTGIPANKNKPINAKRASGATKRVRNPNESSYLPTGPTAVDLIFLRDFFKEHGTIAISDREKKKFPGARLVYKFIPVGECKARITKEESKREDLFGTRLMVVNNTYEAYTFSFFDLDPTQIDEWMGSNESYISLKTSNGRETIREESGTPETIDSDKTTSRFVFEVSDTESGENQVKVIGTLKRLIQACVPK